MIRSAEHDTAKSRHLVVSRRPLRWILGMASAVFVAWPSLSALTRPGGSAILKQHVVSLKRTAQLLNVLGEVSQIGRTTQSVAIENDQMVTVLHQMNREEAFNRTLTAHLKLSRRQLLRQLADVTTLEHLTGEQIPLTETILGTTTSLASMMRTVQQSAAGQAQDMEQVASLSSREEQVMARLQRTNAEILDHDLIPAVSITQSMAGR